jgi:ribosome maturation factor RimP
VTGRVLSADEQAVTLDVDGAPRVLSYAEVVRGSVQVEFGRKDEPLEELDEAEDQDEEVTP